ncbi:hypothetical protein Tco_1175317 [Tanacetum coccineum]
MKNVKSVQLDECDLIKFEDASTVVMVNVKEIDTKSCATFKSNESLKKPWITSQEVSPSFVVDERMIWIEICGFSLCAWGNVDPNEALDDFIQHVVEEKEVEKTPPKDPNVDDSKPPGFEKGHIYNKDDVTSQAGDEDVSFSMDQVKDNHTVTHKDVAADEVVSDNSKAPSFENFIKENKACSRSSSTLIASKCSTSFANYSRKDLKGFSFIDEMNRMIEVGGALGYDVKGCKKSVRRLINGIDFEDFVKEKWAAISNLKQSKPLHTKLKDLKSHFKLWYPHTKEVEANRKNYILATLRDFDKKIDDGHATDVDRTTRISRMQELEDLENLESMDLV